MSETMLNCDMPCSETQNASALARPGKLWESQVDHAFLTESPSLKEKRTGKTKFHFMFWQKTRSIENPGLVKPLRRQANIKFENMTRSEKLGKGYSS